MSENKWKETPLSYDDLVRIYKVYQQAYGELKEGVVAYHRAVVPLIKDEPDRFLPIVDPMLVLEKTLSDSLDNIGVGIASITKAAGERGDL